MPEEGGKKKEATVAVAATADVQGEPKVSVICLRAAFKDDLEQVERFILKQVTGDQKTASEWKAAFAAFRQQ